MANKQIRQPRDGTSLQATLLAPSMQHDFTITIQLNPLVRVGQGPWGQRNWISFSGGSFTATWGRGVVHPGGQDSQLVIPDLSTKVSTNYLLETDDTPPAHIVVRTEGWRTGPREVLEALFTADAGAVDPKDYSFRLFVSLETGDERYRFLNTGMWVGSGLRKGSEVTYDAYRIG